MIPERIQYLLASAERVRILEALRSGPTRQCTLRRECSLARSTVHRNLRGCEERNWVVGTCEGYELTQAGEQILDAYQQFADTVCTIADHEPVLEHLHGVDEPLPSSALDDCQTTPTVEDNPHAPSIAAADVIRRNAGKHIRIAASGVSPITNEAGWDALDAGSHLETIVDEPLYETLQHSYSTTVEAALDCERFDLLLSPGTIDTGIVLAGDEVCVVVHDESGNTQAVLTGSTRELRDWAEGVYRRIREGTTPVETGAAVARSES